MAQFWQGVSPSSCDHCGGAITDAFSDMKTRLGPWANLCDSCVANVTYGKYGVGFGQRYVRQSNGKWLKVAG